MEHFTAEREKAGKGYTRHSERRVKLIWTVALSLLTPVNHQVVMKMSGQMPKATSHLLLRYRKAVSCDVIAD